MFGLHSILDERMGETRCTARKGDACWEYRAPSQVCIQPDSTCRARWYNKQERGEPLPTAFRQTQHSETVAVWENPPHVRLDVRSIPLSSKDPKGVSIGHGLPFFGFTATDPRLNQIRA